MKHEMKNKGKEKKMAAQSSSSSPVRHHLLRRQPVHHGDAPPLDVRPPLAGRRVGVALLAVGQSERGLQVAQRQRPADGPEDVDAAGLGERLVFAHVEPNQLLDRVEAVGLQHILDLRANTGFKTPSLPCNMNSWMFRFVIVPKDQAEKLGFNRILVLL